MIKLYICCLVLITGSVEVGPDIDIKFHQEMMEIVSYDSTLKQFHLHWKFDVCLSYRTGSGISDYTGLVP